MFSPLQLEYDAPSCKWKPTGKCLPSRCLECSEICIVPYLLQGWTLWPDPVMYGFLSVSHALFLSLIYCLLYWWDIQSLGTNKASNMAFRNGVIRESFFFFSLFLLLPHFYWSMALFRIITWMEMLNEDAGSDPLCLLLKDVLMAMDFKWWFTELKTGYGCN